MALIFHFYVSSEKITWQKVCIEVEMQRLWISGTLALSGTVGGTC